jgi:hypothetical protein
LLLLTGWSACNQCAQPCIEDNQQESVPFSNFLLLAHNGIGLAASTDGGIKSAGSW